MSTLIQHLFNICCGKADYRGQKSRTHHTDIASTSLAACQTTSWIQDCQFDISSAVKQSTYLSGRRYSSRLRKFRSLPQVLFGEKVLCHSYSQSFWWQMFSCSWTTYLEKLTCQSARQGSRLHRMQKTTENIHVLDGLRRNVTFFIIAPYKYSYLLTYLFTYLYYWRHFKNRQFTTSISDSIAYLRSDC